MEEFVFESNTKLAAPISNNTGGENPRKVAFIR
jgi:hypothetical protein